MTTQAGIVEGLTKAYWMEIETVQNYIANSINLDGVRAEEIKTSLAADVAEELTHAQSFAKRIKELDGKVPGSVEFKPEQTDMQPPADSTDVVSVIKGVIAAEQGAMEHYRSLIKLAESLDDYVTADLVTTVLADEEGHRRQFVGFLKEYEQ